MSDASPGRVPPDGPLFKSSREIDSALEEVGSQMLWAGFDNLDIAYAFQTAMERTVQAWREGQAGAR